MTPPTRTYQEHSNLIFFHPKRQSTQFHSTKSSTDHPSTHKGRSPSSPSTTRYHGRGYHSRMHKSPNRWHHSTRWYLVTISKRHLSLWTTVSSKPRGPPSVVIRLLLNIIYTRNRWCICRTTSRTSRRRLVRMTSRLHVLRIDKARRLHQRTHVLTIKHV